jgi:hypothetical protein
MVEFALVSILLLTIVFGIMDWGYFYTGKVAATNATRTAARYGAVHPSSWTTVNPPAASTIEAALVLQAIPAVVINQDNVGSVKSYVEISYTIPGPGGGTVCGQYYTGSPAGHTPGFTGTFDGIDLYTQSECVVAGNIVTVKAVYTYRFLTPFLTAMFQPGTLTISTQASELIEG